MKKEKKIVLKGQKYATPKTESVEVKNEGVLCGSGFQPGAKVTFGPGSISL